MANPGNSTIRIRGGRRLRICTGFRNALSNYVYVLVTLWLRLGLGALGAWILQSRAIEMGTCGGEIEAEE